MLKQKTNRGMRPLFEEVSPQAAEPPAIVGDDKKEKMFAERELLSLNLTAHPLDFLEIGKAFTRMNDLPGIATGRRVQIIGSVIGYQTPPTRNGKRVVYIVMEDGTGLADITVFSDVQEKCGHVMFRESWLKVTGKVQRRGPRALSIIAEDLTPVVRRIGA